MKATIVLLVCIIGAVFCQGSGPSALPWPEAWNATVLVTLSDLVIGAPAQVYYDYTQFMQITEFSQCAVVGGAVLPNEPCTLVQSSQPNNHGVSSFKLASVTRENRFLILFLFRFIPFLLTVHVASMFVNNLLFSILKFALI
jgi:hypothetical protein